MPLLTDAVAAYFCEVLSSDGKYSGGISAKETTRASIIHKVTRWVELSGEPTMEGTTEDLVIRVQKRLLADGLKPSYIEALKLACARLFNYGVKRGVLLLDGTRYIPPSNPFATAPRMHLPPRQNLEVTVEDLRTVVDMSSADPDNLALRYLAFLIHTGMRKTEVMMLRWEQIELADKYHPAAGLLRFRPAHVKSNRFIDMPISHDAARALPERSGEYVWLFRPDISRRSKGEMTLTSERMRFTAMINNELKRIRPVIRKDITLHDLRRAYAQRLYAAGMSLEDIRDVLSHSSIEITKSYVKHAHGIESRARVVSAGAIAIRTQEVG